MPVVAVGVCPVSLETGDHVLKSSMPPVKVCVLPSHSQSWRMRGSKPKV